MTGARKPNPIPDAARQWWNRWHPKPNGGGDRAAFAQLRRCHAPEAAAAVPAALALARAFGIASGDDIRLPDALVTAIVLAHVRADDHTIPPAKHLRPVLSPLRFARLLAADSPGERIRQFRRAAALAEHRLDVGRLAAALMDWPRNRVPWAFDYHDVEPPLPETTADTEEPT